MIIRRDGGIECQPAEMCKENMSSRKNAGHGRTEEKKKKERHTLLIKLWIYGEKMPRRNLWGSVFVVRSVQKNNSHAIRGRPAFQEVRIL